MSLFSLYLLTLIPSIGKGLAIVGSSIFAIIGAGILADIKPRPLNTKGWVVMGIICLILSLFIPKDEHMHIIIGGYITTNTEGVEKLPTNLVNALNSFLETVVSDIKEVE